MDITRVKLPAEMIETLQAIYKKAKKHNPNLNESTFFEEIIGEWLEPYKRDRILPVMRKGEIKLRNNLKYAIKLCGKSQAQIAREVGINRSYLSQILNGQYEPSTSLALLLTQAVGYPPEKFNDLFFLEPAKPAVKE